ncbi:hypothetical protein [Fluviicola sp.]|uniref:hypothetical protein n=1 Tax=Fluviicola sp. TaxID=1917219 RepID=UPI0031DBB020
MKPNFYSRGSQDGTVKILLFSFFVMLFGLSGYAQVGKDLAKPPKESDTVPINAYYLAKDMYSFFKIPHSVKILEAKKILTKLCYYAGTDEPYEIKKMIEGSTVMETLLDSLQNTAQFVSDSIKVKKILDWKNSTQTTVIALQKKDTLNKRNRDVLQKAENILQNITNEIKVEEISLHNSIKFDEIILGDKNYTKALIKSIDGTDSIKFNYALLIHLQDSIQQEKKNIDSEALAIFNSQVDSTKDNLLGIKMNWNNVKAFITEFGNRINTIQQQNAQITISLMESSAGSVSGWKMPSEAEMIDAVATYIASRVKQETVLWFFDQMRNNTERYELIMTAFPETMNLIQSSEVFDAPNMGSAWKYALSKDFVHLPKNILSSEWIKERIPKEQQKYLDLTCISWEIGELVSNRLSYRDLIKQLYLKRNLDDPTQIDNFPDSIITFLYAVSNELYIVNNASVRNLTYEEINSMPFGQLEIMLELLNMKYSNSIDKLFLQKFEHKITKDHKKDIAKWIGNTMLALSQFDKIMQQVEQSRKGDKGETVLFDGYNTWQLISQVVRSSLPTRKESVYKKYLDRADDAFEIYHLLSEKNYAGAVSKTLELVDSLIYNEYLIVDTNNYHRDSPFLIALNPKTKSAGNYRIDISTLDNYFIERRVKSKKFPKIARHLNKGDIVVSISPQNIINIGNLKYLKLNKDTLAIALKKGEHKWEKKRIDRFLNKMNKSALDYLIKNRKNWGGRHTDSSFIQFPVNSIAAQAIISSDKKAMQMIMKLASFLNDVALSDNEKELKKVIESYALPPGSYKQKRNSWHSLTLNAFAGPYVGFETAGFLNAKRKDDGFTSCAWNYGISAPIGITYTKTFGKRIYNTSRLPDLAKENPDYIKIKRKNLYKRTNASLSFTLTAIDIGAVVSYRMSHTENVLDQSFKWEQFISPGFNIGMAIPKTPLTVQLGYQYTPKVRRIITEQVDTGEEVLRKDEHFGMWRAYLGVYFDIPLVNLWMKTRSVKYE